MKLYFFRHGDAEPGTREDFNRRLTARGITRTRAAGQALIRMEVQPTHLFSSPRIRARETADILAEALGVPVLVDSALDMDFHVDGLLRLITGLDIDAEVLMVGHEPGLSTVIGAVTGARVNMKKGGLARVELYSLAPPTGELDWVLVPRMFDLLAG